MNKKEVLEFLGVSSRTLTNYMRQGKLSVRYEKGKNGKEALFDAEEVRALEERLSVEFHRPAVLSSSEDSLPAPLPTVPSEYFLQALQTLALASPKKRSLLITEVAAKPVLKVEEASLLTGFSEGHLRDAITKQTLKARKIDRSWRIRREDLDLYVRELFT